MGMDSGEIRDPTGKGKGRATEPASSDEHQHPIPPPPTSPKLAPFAFPLTAEPSSFASTSTLHAPLPPLGPPPAPLQRHRLQRSQASFDWFSDSAQSTDARDGALGASTDDDDESGRFRGVFTAEETERGARRLRRSSIQEGSAGEGSPLVKLQSRAASMGPVGRARSRVKYEEETRSEDEGVMQAASPGLEKSKIVRKKRPGWSRAFSRMSALTQGQEEEDDGDESNTENVNRLVGKPGGGWKAIRQKLRRHPPMAVGEVKQTLTGSELITEMTLGVLPLLIVRLATMEDEKGGKRIPVLMNYLKLRITGVIRTENGRHAVFRIELAYCDAVKWTIYRSLRDLVNLHAHFRVSNIGKTVENFPTFPKTTLPYLKWLKGEGKAADSKTNMDRGNRKALETYLLQLIRATMFGSGANRLCKFLEISAMSIALSTQGGEQGKQGYLRIMSSGVSRKRPAGFDPFVWAASRDPKWFLVRDSYLLVVSDPAATEIYEVFLLDSFFEIEVPKRVYRQGLQIFSHHPHEEEHLVDNQHTKAGGEQERWEVMLETSKPVRSDPERFQGSSNHTFYLKSAERRLHLVAKTERQQDQFIASIEHMQSKSIWAGKNRFDSFAPIRTNVKAQWLVDGRDYFWALSRAIRLAKEKIYLHNWWVSPEMFLRRPPEGNDLWRLDQLLQRKAREGVLIYIIVYNEVTNEFTPVDSNYTKTKLRALHPNINIQRSPAHNSTSSLFWSHHEKMCIVDDTLAFMGGLDLAFGRWDTPSHTLIDDATRPTEQIWRGKDYSNVRAGDWHTLNRPDEDMYDRSKVPRQPWHDIGLELVGQPARDLGRHFIQRWNYLLRTHAHSVEMPFLIPSPDFTNEQLKKLGIAGTCEVQMLRSAAPWSLGISHVEHSIQNAYIKAIELSDHFVYIENQFFITSTEVEGVRIENKIGDALVSRILKAHAEDSPWRAVIVLPLVPGYPFPIDHPEAGSVRLILECQFRTICRGDSSIFARLRRENIEPEDYISFFGLRTWDTLSTGSLTTEAIYVHAKAMIVDDRTVIIGSANINERSQVGDRDSEIACIIRDTDMIESTMAGNPYSVGRFAHSMRMRLMREHLGLDVEDLGDHEQDTAPSAPATPVVSPMGDGLPPPSPTWDVTPDSPVVPPADSNPTSNPPALPSIVERNDSYVSRSSPLPSPSLAPAPSPSPSLRNASSSNLGLPPALRLPPSMTALSSKSTARRNIRDRNNPYNIGNAPVIDPSSIDDPLADAFYDTWLAVATRNTLAFRKVFRTVPDDLVLGWQQYGEVRAWEERHAKPLRDATPEDPSRSNLNLGTNSSTTDESVDPSVSRSSSNLGRKRTGSFAAALGSTFERRGSSAATDRSRIPSNPVDEAQGFTTQERDQMEACLKGVQGHLVLFPTKFLEAESTAGNLLFSKDRLPPLSIYD